MLQTVKCSCCGNSFQRSAGRYNEAIKFGWNQYCSSSCQAFARTTRIETVCANLECHKRIIRKKNQFLRFGKAYCSHRCFALVSNREHPRWLWKIKQCDVCGKNFRRNKKYCSVGCQTESKIINRKTFFDEINNFVVLERRIPFKREFGHYSAIRRSFGTWNKFIVASGFKPNPVLFANKHIANDGHKCDSFSERIIDDWLYDMGIKHERNYPYPGNYKFTVDFKIDDYWVEFFGLVGGFKRYDVCKKRKLELAKRLKLKLIAIYPKDLFPIKCMKDKLGFLA
ncbi:MAG TPA: hypothetical protein VLE44_03385 [Candidatus Saccharimonadales bacterium]|nr:hypothetical protein [Candidatus Saccharimonadales bacterium]